jgi:hypothetical protein
MNFIKEKLTPFRVLLAGESYWTCKMTSGKVWSELGEKAIEINHPNGTRQVLVRRLEWLEDIIGSGDIKNVKEIHLHTPKGVACTHVGEPYTGFQFSRGTNSLLTGQKFKNLQVIGAVTDKATGDCTFALWDYQAQRLFVDTIFDQETSIERQGLNNVLDFKAWRDGVISIGPLNIKAMDVRLT